MPAARLCTPAQGQSCTVVLQGASWSGLDFGGHWRLLHYSLKRIFAPVLVSAYWDRGDSSVHVWVVSDLNHPITGELVPGYISLSCLVAPMESPVHVQVASNLGIPDTGTARGQVLSRKHPVTLRRACYKTLTAQGWTVCSHDQLLEGQTPGRPNSSKPCLEHECWPMSRVTACSLQLASQLAHREAGPASRALQGQCPGPAAGYFSLPHEAVAVD